MALPPLLLLLLLLVTCPAALAFPQLPPAFAFQPSQQQMAMAAVGLEPIMPINYPGLSPMVQQRHTLSSPVPLSAFYSGGRGGGFGGEGQQQLLAAMAQQQQHQLLLPLMIRNSQAGANQRVIAGGTLSQLNSLQQPLFPQGMAIGKQGIHPSSAVLPADIPMDVLVGRQIVQNRLDEQSQSIARHHPFPLNPMVEAGTGTSSFGGAFGAAEAQRAAAQQQQPEQQQSGQQSEFEQFRTERIPSPNGQQQSSPAAAAAPPLMLPEGSLQTPFSASRPVISAEPAQGQGPTGTAAADPNASSLPVFLRGAAQEYIDEFKRIIRQPNGSYAEQVRQIDVLVQKMDPERQLMYREFMRENDERERLHRDRVHKTVADMSERAQEQFAKISATLRNPAVADQERWDRVLQLYGKMEPELRNEFEQKFKGFPTFSPVVLK